ncbi:histone family protein nucleoid-structuring protein H-NS [Massilia sp. KIM]|uniref:H-NS histone family protein n=1 Tax=Massilia sp. KIM TaxID=1955422 RepID=UPI00098EA7A6|nr:H-NS histone family protein [Massilia sp. KIM]OON62476.1 histone family protein nucleoid-structuring protein H-NS [Massilia sp. KIM]
MTTYQEYQNQIAELKALAEKARQDEIANARSQVRQLMHEYSLSPEDLFEDKKKSKKIGTVEARYRDPKSGATWTGRGRAPRWLNGRNKEEFVIK